MPIRRPRWAVVLPVLIYSALSVNSASAQRLVPTHFPEQRTIQVRDPSQFGQYRIAESPKPSTVLDPQPDLTPIFLSLDEAIRISLANADVVRILVGASATSSGQTIYDVAITNTSIDQQTARFTPTLSVNNSFNRTESPIPIFNPLVPGTSLITGTRTDSFNTNANLTKQNAFGGLFGAGVNVTLLRTSPGIFPLNPQTPYSTSLSYTQPLLQGAGVPVNLAPVVLAKLGTERSFFQLKDTVQESVRGVIEGYWSLVAARTDVWARRRQVEQLTETVKRIKARFGGQLDNSADLAQAELSLANFRAILITSEANVIQREAALRNILGLPPSDGTRLIPNSPPNDERFHPNWDLIVDLAAERRPDLVELKLILEADYQQLIIARNTALPRTDAVALYRWNGLEGTMPNGAQLGANPGSFTDWTMGVNFSVPLGLRQARAALRQTELIIARDRANLQQGLHNTSHLLATNIRSLDQLYDQYVAYREAREAAKINLRYQFARYRTGTGILLNVLQAITDWGNAITAEAGSLTQYNTQLAQLERQTGTILETHGIYFYEERFASIGPLGRFGPDALYPLDTRNTPNDDMYPAKDEPAEEKFELSAPPNLRERLPDIPYDDIELPKNGESSKLEQLPEPKSLLQRAKSWFGGGSAARK